MSNRTQRISNILILCLMWVSGTLQHGRMMKPVQRSSMWRKGYSVPPNYDDNQLFCGGREQLQRLGGKCGICGDDYMAQVRENEAGGKYALGIITEEYPAGTSSIQVTIEITAYHQGYFEFRLCPHNDPTKPVTQECLNEYPLPIAEATGEPPMKYYPKDRGMIDLMVYLPPDIICTQCVLQWRYRTGNSWGQGADGKSCLGCGVQEEFRNCADISIGADSGLPNTVVEINGLQGNNQPDDTLQGSSTHNNSVHGNNIRRSNVHDKNAKNTPFSDLSQEPLSKRQPLVIKTLLRVQNPPLNTPKNIISSDSQTNMAVFGNAATNSALHKDNTDRLLGRNTNNNLDSKTFQNILRSTDQTLPKNAKVQRKQVNGRIQFLHQTLNTASTPKRNAQISIINNSINNIPRDSLPNLPTRDATKTHNPTRARTDNVERPAREKSVDIGGTRWIDVKPWSSVSTSAHASHPSLSSLRLSHISSKSSSTSSISPSSSSSSSSLMNIQKAPLENISASSTATTAPSALLTQILEAIKSWQERLHHLTNLTLRLVLLSNVMRSRDHENSEMPSHNASPFPNTHDARQNLSSAAHAFPLPEVSSNLVTFSRSSMPVSSVNNNQVHSLLNLRLQQALNSRRQAENYLQVLSDRAYAEIDKLSSQNKKSMAFQTQPRHASLSQSHSFAYPLEDTPTPHNVHANDRHLDSPSAHMFSFPLDIPTEETAPITKAMLSTENEGTPKKKKPRLYVNRYNTVAKDSLEGQSSTKSSKSHWYDGLLKRLKNKAKQYN